MEGCDALDGAFHGAFRIHGDETAAAVRGKNGNRGERGPFAALAESGGVALRTSGGRLLARGTRLCCQPEEGGVFSLAQVPIGRRFHWERARTQSYAGSLVLQAGPEGTITAINELGVEAYLASVVSSEMNPEAPGAFLQAHAVASRSWLLAMLDRRRGSQGESPEPPRPGEWIRWYDVAAHAGFDVCGDDHCQRYQGIPEAGMDRAARAVQETRGLVLFQGGKVCDARYHKACGGRTDVYATAWEDREVPYLASVADGPDPTPPILGEKEAAAWFASAPEAYCNLVDPGLLGRILRDYDRETGVFFRWRVRYRRGELEDLLQRKSGIDFGMLEALEPLQRGPSGRIVRLAIRGARRSIVVGKELEIRRWLSPTHLLSSAFVVERETGANGRPAFFTLRGGGWGHGVGLCQVGAAVMAHRGAAAREILRHYYPGASAERIYP